MSRTHGQNGTGRSGWVEEEQPASLVDLQVRDERGREGFRVNLGSLNQKLPPKHSCKLKMPAPGLVAEAQLACAP